MKSIIKIIMIMLLIVPALHARGGGGHGGGGFHGGGMSHHGGAGYHGGHNVNYHGGGHYGHGGRGYYGGYGPYWGGGLGLGLGLPLVGGVYVGGDSDDYPSDESDDQSNYIRD